MQKHTWLAAEYQFPTLYSCRMPFSSDFNALSLPAPGPATVRLALIRTGVELFGVEIVREKLFPVIRSMSIVIRPPDQVAFTGQKIRGYKSIVSGKGNKVRVNESITCREYCHAEGALMIYIGIPRTEEARFRKILAAVGYWGKSDSLTSCKTIANREPQMGEGAVSLASIPAYNLNQTGDQYFTTVLTEFQTSNVVWADVIPLLWKNQPDFLKTEIYVWPLVLIKRSYSQKIMNYYSLKCILKEIEGKDR